MITQRMMRFGAYGCGGLLLYGVLFVILVSVAIAVGGLAIIRSDAFGIAFLLYWFVGAPAIGLVARQIAVQHSVERGED